VTQCAPDNTPAKMLSPRIECRCSGDPREMGLTQGTALREKILAAHRSLRKLEALRLEQPWWLPYPLFLALAERKSEKSLATALRQSSPAMLARLEGIADGAGLPLRSLCLMNAMEAFIASMEERTVVPPPGACSALAVRGTRSATGEPVIAKNFDYLPLFQPFYMLRESRPRDGFSSLDFAVAPQAGTVDGVNEKGLAITLNYAFVTDSGRPNPLITMLIADALATCASVTEAVRRITESPRWGAGILMLADASGDLASVELSNTRAGVRRPADGADWLLFTNVCSCPAICAVQVPESAAYSDKLPLPLRGQSVLQPHMVRARRLEELVRNQSKLGPDELAAVMGDHGPSGMADGESPCVHTDYFNTTASLQWFPRSRRVRVSYGKACTARYVEISL
jgi:predicted choloylglycine hydrolase